MCVEEDPHKNASQMILDDAREWLMHMEMIWVIKDEFLNEFLSLKLLSIKNMNFWVIKTT